MNPFLVSTIGALLRMKRVCPRRREGANGRAVLS